MLLFISEDQLSYLIQCTCLWKIRERLEISRLIHSRFNDYFCYLFGNFHISSPGISSIKVDLLRGHYVQVQSVLCVDY